MSRNTRVDRVTFSFMAHLQFPLTSFQEQQPQAVPRDFDVTPGGLTRTFFERMQDVDCQRLVGHELIYKYLHVVAIVRRISSRGEEVIDARITPIPPSPP